MKVLIIKTSSLGDVIHTLPALTDAGQAINTIHFDWVVEQSFAEVPRWHPLVNKVIPVSLRRWRKQPWQALRSGEWQTFYRQLKSEKYDFIIDAQSLIKSAFLTYLAKGKRCGLNWQSAWEPLASLAYQHKYAVEPEQHAVVRVRQLFSQALNYPLPNTIADYGIDRKQLIQTANVTDVTDNYLVFLHGTTWPTKHWPENYWQQLAKQVVAAGFNIKIPWGNAVEHERAQRIAQNLPQIQVLPKLNLAGVASVLAGAKACVAVDTGLGHLAAALKVPTLSLYGPTNPLLTGTMGAFQHHLTAKFPCAPCLKKTCDYKGPHDVEPPCFSMLSPNVVWNDLLKICNNTTM